MCVYTICVYVCYVIHIYIIVIYINIYTCYMLQFELNHTYDAYRYIYIHPHIHICKMWMFVIKQSKTKVRKSKASRLKETSACRSHEIPLQQSPAILAAIYLSFYLYLYLSAS